MNKGEIVTYRGKKYKIHKITIQKKKYSTGEHVTKRAYISPYGWKGENRVAIIKKEKIEELEKKQLWGTHSSYYKSW